MTYSKQLLPQKGYRSQVDIDSLLGEEFLPLVMVRRCNVPVTLCGTTETKLIHESCLEDNIFNYSINLLGGGFDPMEHIAIRQQGDGIKPWDGTTFLDENTMERCYSSETPAYSIYYRVEDFHRIDIPYKRNFNKAKDYANFLDANDEQARKRAFDIWQQSHGVISMTGWSLVVHAPTMMNYWHVELRVENRKEGGETHRQCKQQLAESHAHLCIQTTPGKLPRLRLRHPPALLHEHTNQ